LKDSSISPSLLHEFLIVIIPVWISWFTIDYFGNMFASSTFTYKVFSWIYHICVLAMGSSSNSVFVSQRAADTFIISYFLSQFLAFFFSLSLYMTMPKVAGSFVLFMGINLISVVPALFSIGFHEALVPLWWVSWALQLISVKVTLSISLL
jgi:hypothetical protein